MSSEIRIETDTMSTMRTTCTEASDGQRDAPRCAGGTMEVRARCGGAEGCGGGAARCPHQLDEIPDVAKVRAERAFLADALDEVAYGAEEQVRVVGVPAGGGKQRGKAGGDQEGGGDDGGVGGGGRGG